MQGEGYTEEEGVEEEYKEDVDPDGAHLPYYSNEPIGEADEWERICSLIKRMEQDDREANESPEYDISDDGDDASVPVDWDNPNFNNLMVNEGNQMA